MFVEKHANDSNVISLGLVLDQVKISSSLIITSNWIYSSYLRFNPSSGLIFDLLNRITSPEDFHSILHHLIDTRDLSIPKRIEILQYSLELIRSKEWKRDEDFCLEQLQRLQVFEELLSEYSEEDLNRLDQTDDLEEILSDILIKHQQFHLVIFLKTRIFPQISIDRVLQLTIEKFNEQSHIDERLNTFLESISLNDIDQKQLFTSFQQMCRSETIDRRIRYKIIDKLDKVRLGLF